jgi:hypothetical protein
MRKKLFPHQKDGVKYLVVRYRGALFYLPRNGKTITAIRAMQKLEAFPLLVVTITTLFHPWKQEFLDEGWLEDDIAIINGTKKKRKEKLALNKSIVIINYECLRVYQILSHFNWGGIIFDESFKIANVDSGITKYCLRCYRHISDIPMALLTGSPASESGLNVVPQFFLIDGHFMGYTSMAEYIFDHWKFDFYAKKYVVKKKKHKREIEEYVQKNAHCITIDLSIRAYSTIPVEFNTRQKKALEWAFAKKTKVEELSIILGRPVTLGKMLYMMYENMVCAGIDPETKEIISTAKIDYILKYWKEKPQPLFVISFFVAPIYEMVEKARKMGIRIAYVDGSVDAKTADRIQQRFDAGLLDIVVGQSTKVKMGCDYKKANVSFFLNNNFSFDTRFQVECRVLNINKKESVKIIDMVTTGGIDNNVVLRLKDKEKDAKGFIDSRLENHINKRLSKG